MLAAALKRIGFDLVVAGNESTDGRGGVVPAMVAEHLRLPLLPSLTSVEVRAMGSAGTAPSTADPCRCARPFLRSSR